MIFSVIVCTLNSEEYLEDCLSSIANQNFKNFETIIIDGHSTDKTGDILKKYKNRLKLKIHKQKPRGISAAMNEGVRRARGNYVIHLHSDDSFYDKNVLKDVNRFLKAHPKHGVIYSKIVAIESNGDKIGVFPKYKILQIGSKNLLKYFNYIPHQATFIKKGVFKRCGNFDETLKSKMDYDLWLRLIDKTPFIFLDRIVANFRVHPNSQSSGEINKEDNQKNLLLVKERYLTKKELYLSKKIEWLLGRINKMYRQ